MTGTGGRMGSGGEPAKGGSNGSGGTPGSGGNDATGGVTGFGGSGSGGSSVTGGSTGNGSGGAVGTGGVVGTGGKPGTGAAGAGGARDGMGGTAGGAGTGADNNVVPVIVDRGPSDVGTQDVPFISVTVCLPGTETCATIDHVSVDTGSTGLRLIASALPSGFKLPQQMTGGKPEAECFTFADGYVWGSVRLADLRLGGETARNMQLQLIGDPAYPTVPSDCKATGSPENTVADFGANGILGISQWVHDCNTYCSMAQTAGYYSCSGTNCTGVAMPIANQLANPISLLGADGNGAVLTFPAVPAAGAATLSGTLTFGVGTRANNALGGAQTLTVDADNMLATVFNGKTMDQSFIDSGTSLLSFDDSSLTQCKSAEAGFYCPTSLAAKTATITGRNNTSTAVKFNVANADTLFKSGFSAFDNLAATGDSSSFDWGFPFFIGRKVFIGFAVPSSQNQNGYVAY